MWKSKSKGNDKEAVNLFAAKGQEGRLPDIIIVLITMINMITMIIMITVITMILITILRIIIINSIIIQ